MKRLDSIGGLRSCQSVSARTTQHCLLSLWKRFGIQVAPRLNTMTGEPSVCPVNAPGRGFVAIWVMSAAVLSFLRFLNTAELSYDATIQIEAAQHLLMGKGLSTYALAASDLAQPLPLSRMTSWPCGYSLVIAGLIAAGCNLAIAVKLIGLAATVLGWWGWGRLAYAYMGPSFASSRGWFWSACSVAAFTPMQLTFVWGGTDILLWAIVPWALIFVHHGSDAEARWWIDAATGCLCGTAVLMRYAGIGLAGYCLFLVLWQSGCSARTLARRWGAFFLGIFPFVCLQLFVNVGLERFSGPASLDYASGWADRIERLSQGLYLLSCANAAVVFWLPRWCAETFVQSGRYSFWLFGLTLSMFALPFVLAIKQGHGIANASRDLRVTAAGFLIFMPLFLWACMAAGSHTYAGDHRYYYPLVPLVLFACWSLAHSDKPSKGASFSGVRCVALSYVSAYVVFGCAVMLVAVLPVARGKGSRGRIIATNRYSVSHPTQLAYELSPSRTKLIEFLRNEPGSVLLTNLEGWFFAEPAIDRSRLHRFGELSRFHDLAGPVRVLIFALDTGASVEELARAKGPITTFFESIPNLRVVARFPEEYTTILEARLAAGEKVLFPQELDSHRFDEASAAPLTKQKCRTLGLGPRIWD